MQELRTTTGQRIRIGYDPMRNQMIFEEDDWCASPLQSTAMPVKSAIVRPVGSGLVVKLRRRSSRPNVRAA